jgi:hypothetical protein
VLLYDSLAYDLPLSHEISLWCFLETTSVSKAFLAIRRLAPERDLMRQLEVISETVIEQHPATCALTEDHHPPGSQPRMHDLGVAGGTSARSAFAQGLSLSSAGGLEIKAGD